MAESTLRLVPALDESPGFAALMAVAADIDARFGRPHPLAKCHEDLAEIRRLLTPAGGRHLTLIHGGDEAA